MKNYKVSFYVISQSELIDKISDIMSRYDLGINKVEAPIDELVTWKTTAVINKEYLSKMKKKLKEAYAKQGRRIIAMRRKK